ncbi:MAG: N-acetyltransferase [Saprospiraceae bacterium]|nr:N-acetyltransferase [Saprospiraceae bacterium]
MQKKHPDYLDFRVDPKNSRIFAPVTDEEDIELRYNLITDTQPTTMEFTYTFVPEPIRRQGIASQLVLKGLRLAKKSNYKVKASCPFVEHFLEKHSEFQPMAVGGR